MSNEPTPTRSIDELADHAVRRGYALRRRDRVRWTVAITVIAALIVGTIPFLLRNEDVRSGLVDEPNRPPARATIEPDEPANDDRPVGRTLDRVGQAPTKATPRPVDKRSIGTNDPLIAFIGHREPGLSSRGALMVMTPSGTNQRSLGIESFDLADPAWSPDGEWLAYTYDGSIYTLNLETRENQLLTKPPDIVDSGPSWSPDGRRIAFASRSEQGTTPRSDIMVMNADGTGRRRLMSTSDLDETEPDWSPDGRSIAFARNGSGDPGIFVMKPDGTGVRRLTNGQDLEPDWSPDGDTIAYTRYNTATQTPSDIYTIRSDGSAPRQLTNTVELFEYKADWSPDGDTIAYTRDPDGKSNPANDPFANATACFAARVRCQTEQSGIYTMRADGSGVDEITGYSNGDSSPTYRPN